jgi:hypothetical protein
MDIKMMVSTKIKDTRIWITIKVALMAKLTKPVEEAEGETTSHIVKGVCKQIEGVILIMLKTMLSYRMETDRSRSISPITKQTMTGMEIIRKNKSIPKDSIHSKQKDHHKVSNTN